MRADFMQHNHIVHAFPNTVIAANEDIFNGNPGSDVISMMNASGAVFIITTNANAGGNATVTVLACTDTTPTTTTPIAFAYRQIEAANTDRPVSNATSVGFATSTGANVVYVVEVDAAELASLGYKYVQLKCTEKTNNAVDGAIVGFLTGMRYANDNVASQV